ncbi:MAG: hypothetical protein RR348_03015 [Clostridia bacterium]
MNEKCFTIQNFPNDIYNAVGQIIKSAQEWEQKYKKLAFMLNVPIKKINNSSLNKLNEALKKYNLIDEKEYKDLKEVIKTRNYINHDFYLTDFQNSDDNYDKYIEKLEKILNSVQFLIFEATDVIDNKIDKFQGSNIVRPTIFV